MAGVLSVTVVGPGRLGRHVAGGLAAAGHAVRLVGRGEPVPPADLTWFALPDDVIKRLPAGPGVRLHSAGALGPEVLGEHGAVLHPLMTFPPPPGAQISATLDGAPAAVALARRLAETLGWTVLGGVIDRSRYHAAAALASGHTAALFLDAVQLLASATGAGEPAAAAALLALSQASLQNVAAAGASAITGPAARGDLSTIEAHRRALPAETIAIYDALTERIRAQRR